MPPGAALGSCIGRRGVAWRGPRMPLPSRLCSPFCSTSSGPGPRAGLSHRWFARSRCHGQSQRVRAGEPVGALSHDAQVPPPPFNAQAVRADESEEDALRASPGASPWGGSCRPTTKRAKVRYDKRRSAVSCFGEATRHERPGEVCWFTRDPARDSRGPTPRRVAPGAGTYLGVCSCKFG